MKLYICEVFKKIYVHIFFICLCVDFYEVLICIFYVVLNLFFLNLYGIQAKAYIFT